MATDTPKFDPIKYKETTEQQWQAAAEAWHRWGPTLATWLDPVTETMLDMAGVGAGNCVLDVAAGAGEQTLVTARRVGPSGHVLATDISANIIEFAAAEARAADLTNVETRVMDGENLDELEADSFVAVISRVGLIYFPDQQKALTGMRRALKPGGRIAAIVYSTSENNRFFSIPISIIRKRAQLPPPLPGQPGPFSLGSPGHRLTSRCTWHTAYIFLISICTPCVQVILALDQAASRQISRIKHRQLPRARERSGNTT